MSVAARFRQLQQASVDMARAADAAPPLTPKQILDTKMTPEARALRTRQLQELMNRLGPEGMALRAEIAAENRAAAQARAAAREVRTAPILKPCVAIRPVLATR
jgi:hypothetical protein